MKTTLIDHMGSDLTVVNAARVSFNKRSTYEFDMDCAGGFCGDGKIKDNDERLINYLGKHNHISPFGHCFATFHVAAPIFVARQLVKHKFLRWNEVSRRYVSDEPEFYIPTLRKATKDKKQGSGDELPDHICDEVIRHSNIEAVKQYNYLLKRGVCEEQARMILPQNTITEWYWSGSMDAFASMCNLRCKEDTQYETRIIAQDISDQLSSCWPISWRSLSKHLQ